MRLMIHVLLLFLFLTGGAYSWENTARVKFMLGKVERQQKNQTSWNRLRLNSKVFSGDRIKTSVNARIEIEMPDGTVVRVDQNSIFDVKSIKTDEDDGEDEMSFSLWAGNIWARFKKIVSDRQTRRIESPSAVVAIRGTTLEVNVDKQLTTRVSVVEGKVAVSSREAGGEVLVGSNQQTVVRKGQAPQPPSAIPARRKSTRSAFALKVDKPPLQITDPSLISGGLRVSGSTVPGATVTVNGSPLTVDANGKFNGRVPVVEGANRYTVEARYKGQTTQQKIAAFVNTKKPRIKLSSPLVTGYLNKRGYSLSGAVFDETPQDKVKVYINGEEVAEVRGRGSFNRTVILQEGQNNIRLTARDLSKNSTEKTQSIFLDTVKPIITVTEPAQQNFIRLEPPGPPRLSKRDANRFTQIIRGVIIDPEPSSGLQRLVINGKEIKPNSDGSFETEINLKRGENRLVILVEDKAGNIGRDANRRIIVR